MIIDSVHPDVVARRAQLVSKPPETVIYETVYGSWAHGTNTPTSDVDWRGVYLLPTDDFLGLDRPKTTWEDKSQDRVFWELGHFCSLLLKGNPNIVGMLFAPNDCLIHTSTTIEQLRTIRHKFVSQSLRSAYMGWIHREAEDLGKAYARLGERHFPMKRLSHLPRLIWELESALLDGVIVVRPERPKIEYIVNIKTSQVTAQEAIADVGDMILNLEELDHHCSRLPEAPRDELNDWLLTVRRLNDARPSLR